METGFYLSGAKPNTHEFVVTLVASLEMDMPCKQVLIRRLRRIMDRMVKSCRVLELPRGTETGSRIRSSWDNGQLGWRRNLRNASKRMPSLNRTPSLIRRRPLISACSHGTSLPSDTMREVMKSCVFPFSTDNKKSTFLISRVAKSANPGHWKVNSTF